MTSYLRTRLRKLEKRRTRPRGWQPAAIFYDPAQPGDRDRKRTEVYEQAWSEGWRPDSFTPLAYFLPENHRPHPGRT